jgi:hypothetical protein
LLYLPTKIGYTYKGSKKKCICKDNYLSAYFIRVRRETYSEVVPLGAGAGVGFEPDPEFKAAVMKLVPRF